MFRLIPDSREDVVAVHVDGVEVKAQRGETVAALLLRQETNWSRLTPISGQKRAPYCMMGVCFECLATIDGVPSLQTCLTGVEDGMRVERQRGRPEASA
ncbi:MAG: (2Fe-2S)-binding protein [Pseudomonadota bacterium]